MWIKEYIRDFVPPEKDYSNIGVAANLVSLLDPATSTNFRRAIIKFPDTVLPAVEAFGANARSTDLTYLQECKVSFTAGFSDAVPGLMFTPDHAFVIEHEDNLQLISESC